MCPQGGGGSNPRARPPTPEATGTLWDLQLGAEAALTYLSADKLSWAVLCAAFTLPLGS